MPERSIRARLGRWAAKTPLTAAGHPAQIPVAAPHRASPHRAIMRITRIAIAVISSPSRPSARPAAADGRGTGGSGLRALHEGDAGCAVVSPAGPDVFARPMDGRPRARCRGDAGHHLRGDRSRSSSLRRGRAAGPAGQAPSTTTSEAHPEAQLRDDHHHSPSLTHTSGLRDGELASIAGWPRTGVRIRMRTCSTSSAARPRELPAGAAYSYTNTATTCS